LASVRCSPPKPLETKLQAQPTADIYVELGSWFHDHDSNACAAEAYRSGLKLDPASPRLLYLLGLSLLRQGDAQNAVPALQQAIKIRPDILKPHLLLAEALEQLQKGNEARVEWAAGLAIDPHSAIALDGMSKNLMEQGDYASVIRLLGPSPAEESLILDMAEAYHDAGMDEQAADTLRKAVEKKPASAPLNKALITLLVLQFQNAEAAKLATRLVQLYPHDLAAKKLYLRVLVLNNDTDLGRPLAANLLSTAPHDFEVLYLAGALERESGDYTAAANHLSQAVALNPNDYSSRYAFGFVLAQLHEPRAAREQLEKAIALGETGPEVHFQLAGVLRTLGESKEAEEQFRLYQQEQQAKANRTSAAIKVGQADKEFTDGDPQKAAALYREATAAMPDNAMIQYKLALALDRTGDISSERLALQKALEIDPSMATAHYQYGYLASRTGDTKTAEEQFQEAVRAAPAYVEAWIGLAGTLGMESRFAEAQSAVESALRLDPKNAEALQLRHDLAAAAGRATP
jgi:Flp pilus assembly protein TadD